MLDYDSNVVIAGFPPDVSEENMLKEANGRTLIKMTLENSPAYIGGTYENGKFIPPEGAVPNWVNNKGEIVYG